MRLLILLICLCLKVTNLLAQADSKIIQQAFKAYEDGDFFMASSIFKNASVHTSKNKDNLWCAALSAYHANDLNYALKCFQSHEIISENKALFLNMAKTFHQLHAFEQAQYYYKKYLRQISIDHIDVSYCKNELLRCKIGISLKRKNALAFVVPLAININTPENEFALIENVNRQGSYFLSACRTINEGGKRNTEGLVDEKLGIYFADVYSVNENNELWTVSPKLFNGWNSSMHDEVVGFLNKQAILLQYRNDQSCKYVIDSFNDNGIHLNYPNFTGPLFPEIGDHAIALFQDSLMLFSSCRMGGFGGYDLYLSVLRNANWSAPINLGPYINGPFNEDYPYLSNDGQTLYFSSNSLASMGGYDIFKSKFHPEAAQWERPKNLGIPINSPGDEIHFKLRTDGLSAIYSSNRKLNCQGGFDIFKAFFNDELEHQLQIPHGSPLSLLLDNSQGIFDTYNNSRSQFNNDKRESEVKEYFVDDLFYKEQNVSTEPKNQNKLSQLVEILKIFPRVHINLYGNAFEESPIPINLYYSIQKAEEIQNYLEEHGITSSRIHCFGFGARFPKAKLKINGIPSLASAGFNKRVEYYLINTDSIPIQINYLKTPIPPTLLSEHEHSNRLIRKGISYSIYLGVSNSILNHPVMKNTETVFFVEKEAPSNAYSYYMGVYKKFEEAINFLNITNFETDVKPLIYVFKDGIKLSRKEIIDHVIEESDLIRYLNYLNETKE